MLKYVVTAAQMQSADRHTSEKTGIPSLVLMERAALAVADEIVAWFDGDCGIKGKKVCILCGSGNNGGDGFALGRILTERGCKVNFFMPKEGASSEANRLQQEIIKNLGMDISTAMPENEYDIVADALFGTGLKREISGIYAEWIAHVNQMKGFKVAVDIPSGVDSDYGAVLGTAFQADLTVTFAFLKWGHTLYPGRACCGKTIVHDIGIGVRELCDDMPYGRCLEAEDIPGLLPQRYADSHKGTYKKAGIIAGSDEIGGAVILSGKAAMRTGVGYTKILTTGLNRTPILKHCPEALVFLYDNPDKTIVQSVSDVLDCETVAIGPGLGTGKVAAQLLEQLLEQYNGNLVIDADGLNLLHKHPELFEKCRKYTKKAALNNKIVVLTPHKKEFCRITGISMDEDAVVFHEKALQLSTECGMIVVLKDAATRIYLPDGTVYVNLTGNSGMATAGSGDVLTGILTGLISQTAEPQDAVILGVYLHGCCGDYVLSLGNPYSLTAMDMVEAMMTVLKERHK